MNVNIRSSIKVVSLGGGYVFSGKEIYIQSMLKKPAEDVDGNVKQAKVKKIVVAK